MSIARKVRSVERLFAHLEKASLEFQQSSGLHCLSGCGKCCTKPDIEATPLEFLPFALDTFLAGKGEETLEKLKREADNICILYVPLSAQLLTSGSCGSYKHRGLVCRLFGFGATRDKFGELRLATCKLIKESQVEMYARTMEAIKADLPVPIFSDYYKRLYQIDARMGSQFTTINDAMKQALEAVLQHYSYRPFPRNLRR